MSQESDQRRKGRRRKGSQKSRSEVKCKKPANRWILFQQAQDDWPVALAEEFKREWEEKSVPERQQFYLKYYKQAESECKGNAGSELAELYKKLKDQYADSQTEYSRKKLSLEETKKKGAFQKKFGTFLSRPP
eukprot:390820_1